MDNLENFFKGKKVFITGHNGFKGSWLSLWLLIKGAHVSGYSLPVSNQISLFKSLELSNFANKNNLIFIDNVGDINNKDFLEQQINSFQPDIVFHLAAQPLVRESYQKPIYTFETNVIGTLNLLESLKFSKKKCSVLLITTDKVYENKEWNYSYRETDRLGGNDPYSASKAAMEIAVDSWRKSFCQNKNNLVNIATARSGNIIGGGDWSEDRIIPDIIRSYQKGEKLKIRNPNATRPWQHVLDPLHGYLCLAKKLFLSIENNKNYFTSAYNFGPAIKSNKKVIDLVNNIQKHLNFEAEIDTRTENLYESKLLSLSSEKALRELQWEGLITFDQAIKITVDWYKTFLENDKSALKACIHDIENFEKDLKL